MLRYFWPRYSRMASEIALYPIAVFFTFPFESLHIVPPKVGISQNFSSSRSEWGGFTPSCRSSESGANRGRFSIPSYRTVVEMYCIGKGRAAIHIDHVRAWKTVRYAKTLRYCELLLVVG
jgi:hypothetical protein